MAKLEELKRYINYEFSSGCYTGEDYKQFERKYISYLKSMCKQYGWEFVKANKNHYEFSAFFKYKDKFIYFNISDVRYFKNEWFGHILIRTAKNEKDYTGGQNRYCALPTLPVALDCIFQGANYGK